MPFFLYPFLVSTLHQQRLLSPGNNFDSLPYPSIRLNPRMPQELHIHIKRNLILNLLQNKPRPLPPALHEKQLSSAVNFANTFARRLFAQKGATKSAFISICARHCSTLVFALFAPPLSMLCGCLGSGSRGRGAEEEVLAVNLFGLQTAKRQ